MSEAKFTKGDWKVEGSSMSMGANYRGKFTITSSAFAGNISDANTANANLIKASPKMYEMLIKISEAINSGLYEIELADAITEFGGDIEKLLAKARGES